MFLHSPVREWCGMVMVLPGCSAACVWTGGRGVRSGDGLLQLLDQPAPPAAARRSSGHVSVCMCVCACVRVACVWRACAVMRAYLFDEALAVVAALGQHGVVAHPPQRSDHQDPPGCAGHHHHPAACPCCGVDSHSCACPGCRCSGRLPRLGRRVGAREAVAGGTRG